jgi:hypothetical protein
VQVNVPQIGEPYTLGDAPKQTVGGIMSSYGAAICHKTPNLGYASC